MRVEDVKAVDPERTPQGVLMVLRRELSGIFTPKGEKVRVSMKTFSWLKYCFPDDFPEIVKAARELERNGDRAGSKGDKYLNGLYRRTMRKARQELFDEMDELGMYDLKAEYTADLRRHNLL